MTPDKHGKNLTRWLLIATIALLVLVLSLQLWQMFGRNNRRDDGPLAPDSAAGTQAPAPEAPASSAQAPAPEAPASSAQAPAPEAPASSAQTPAPEVPASSAQAPAASDGEEAAKNAAFTHAGVSAADASAVRCKLEWDDGRQVYDIEFRADGTEYDYQIDAATGAVIKAGQETNGHHGGASAQQGGGFIGEEAAKNAAFAHAGVSAADASVLKCELDEDGGRWVYELEFRAGGAEYDYEIDASSGTVVKAEADR